jgi:hypothetical protein
MPCYDGTREYDNSQTRELYFLRAFTCAIFRHLDETRSVEDFLKHLDYKEMGYNEDVVREWWLKHQDEDKRKKAFKERLLKEREIKAKALAKLTEEEIKVLGVKK